MRRDMLKTTIAGSLPKPAWLAKPESLWAPWLLDGATLAQGKEDAVVLALRDQEEAGIEIVTDGEQTRRHFVWGFVEQIDGIDFSRMVTIGIRADRYRAEVPTVIGPLSRRGPIHSAEARFARAHTTRSLKWTMPGPMTVVDTIYDAHYKSRARLGMDVARLINEEARELEALGVDVIQLDEPAFNVYMDEVRDWASRRSTGRSKASRVARPCTSATATASRPTSTGRRRWAASGASTSRRSRSWRAAAGIERGGWPRSRAPSSSWTIIVSGTTSSLAMGSCWLAPWRSAPASRPRPAISCASRPR